MSPLREVALLFTKLGFIGFGGPAAHIALMRDEVVERRRWLEDTEFLDLVGAVNIIPGPNSTELAIHIGRRRAGRAGLVVAGLCFILPAVAIVATLAVLYARFGTRPVAADLLWGVKAVMVAIIASALVALGRTAVKDVWTGIVAVGALVGYLFGVNELVLLAAGALLMTPRAALVLPLTTLSIAAVEPSLLRIGLAFLKVGALLFGSGYVLVAFLENDLVRTNGWLTHAQLLDAVAIGQVTPGPVFSTATFVGYVLAGWAGAVVATIAIFVPSFVFVALTGPLVERVRRSPVLGRALDGVNAAALGLLGGVLVILARDVFGDPWSIPIAVAAFAVVTWTKINNVWVVAAGLLVGLGRTLL